MKFRKSPLKPFTTLRRRLLNTLLIFAIVAGFQQQTHAQKTGLNNAGILSVDSPAVPICAGQNPVYATFENQGKAIVNSIEYEMYFNGSLFKTATLAVKLDTLNGNAGYSTDTSLLLGKPAFSPGSNSVEVRLKKVNGQSDTVNTQDTFRLDYTKTALNGNYTIGTGSGDYNSVTAAVSDLNARGICGPVDFNVQNGTYTLSSTATINNIEGTSVAHDIDFIGQGVNASKISGTLQNSLFELNSASHISFHQLHLENNGSNYNTQVITLRGETNNLTVKDCKLSLNVATSPRSVPGMVVEAFGGSDCRNLTFRDNTVEGGSYNFQILGNPENITVTNNQLQSGFFGGISASDGNNISIDSNVINHTAFYFVSTGVLLEDFQNVKLRNNTVEGNWRDGINIDGTNNTDVTGNTVKGFGTLLTPTSGIYVKEANNILIQNNFVRSTNGSANGILCETSDSSVKVYNNSVRVDNPAIYLRQGAGAQVINNNLKTTDGGNALVYEASKSDGYFNANNYDFPNNGLIYANDEGDSYSKLSGWTNIPAEYRQQGTYDNKLAFTRDANHQSATNLHLNANNAFPRGIDLGIQKDIDGDSRCTIAPSIGADESAYTGKPAPLNVQIPDTVNLKSPIEINNKSPKTGRLYDWYLNGQLVAANAFEPSIEAKQLGKDTLMVVSQACNGKDTLTKMVQVKALSQGPVANFVADNNEVYTNENLPLKDLSQNGVAGWQWHIKPENSQQPPINIFYSFTKTSDRDNLDVDSSQNPHISFLQPGSYDVCLRVYNYDSNGQKRWDTLCKRDYIRVNESFQVCNASTSKAQAGILYDNGGPNGMYESAQTDTRNTCGFTINPCADSIQLTFKTLDLFTDGCGDDDTDYLRIYDGQNASGNPLWSSSNQCPNGITGSMSQFGFDSVKLATSGAVHIEFAKRTDEGNGIVENSGEGFALRWEAKGGNFSKPESTIKGPDTVCINSQATYQAQQLVSNPDAGQANRSWHLNGLGNNPVSGKTFSYSAMQPGIDTINLLTSQCALTDTAKKLVYVKQPQMLADSGFTVDIRNPEVNRGVVSFSNQFGPCANQAQWEISPDSFRYVKGTGPNSLNPKVIFRDTVAYDVRLISGNAGAIDTVYKTDYINPVNRCEPTVSFTNPDIGISRFRLAEIDNRSTIGQSDYTDYTDKTTAILEKGVSYSFKVDRNTNYNSVTRKIWIDYNGDGDFMDSNARFNELVAKQVQSNSKTWQDTFEVNFPETGATRLRVGVFYGDQNGSCGHPQFGEYEDYRVRISDDITAPEIMLSGKDTLYMQACESLADKDTGAKAVDNFLGNITDSIRVTSNVDTAVPGTYTIDYEVYDADSNKAVKQRHVIVQPETTKPDLKLKGDDTVSHPVNQPYRDSGYTAMDDCSGIQSFDTLNSVKTGEIGHYPLKYKAIDSAGNKNQVSRLVKVVDTTTPTIQINPDTVRISVNSSYSPQTPQISDNYWPESSLLVQVTGQVNTDEVGSYKLTYRVSDSSGNGPAKASRTVIIQDTLNPEIRAQVTDSMITVPVYRDVGLGDLVDEVTDNYYDEDKLQITKSGSFFRYFPDGKTDSLGTFTAKVQYTDPSGNKAAFKQEILVIDQEAPRIKLIGPSFVKVSRWEETPYVDSVAVSDNYYGSHQIAVEKRGSYFSDYIANNYPPAPATYEIRYQAVDSSGNRSDKAYRYVEVQPSTSGISREKESARIQVFPNPSDGRFRVKTKLAEAQKIRLRIVNAMGKVVRQKGEATVREKTHRFDLSELAAGVYQIRLETNDEVYSRQLVIQR